MQESVCAWCRSSGLLRSYHDEEWGVPVQDDARLFEFLTLEVMQCGLNWHMMLKKREIFRQCLAGFDPVRLAELTEKEVEEILAFPGMIRSRRKVEAVVGNARAFLALQREEGRFSDWLWAFSGGDMLVYRSHAQGMPSRNALSDIVSRAMKSRGFSYVGSVTAYSLLQACGIINDHEPLCPRFRAVMENASVRWLE